MILELDIKDVRVLVNLLDREIEQYPVESPIRDMLQSIEINILRKVMNNG